MSVEVEICGSCAYVTINSPPVNAIGQSERLGLLNAVRQVDGLKTVERVILVGSGSIFAAGADTREFNSDPIEPHLPDVVLAIESCSVPWIAAISGAALGGGAEIALGCRYRIAAPSSSIGFPEVTLGVVPGAGATQRLPRLVGLSNALEMISEGKPIDAIRAQQIGLIDAVAADPRYAAKDIDLTIVERRKPLSQIPVVKADDAAVNNARERAKTVRKGQTAPLRAVDLVALASKEHFAEAIKEERAAFLSLRQSEQAIALRHVFFAERKARSPDWLPDQKPSDLHNAVVVGGGTMGAAIAYALDTAGFNSTIVEADEDAAGRARDNTERLIKSAIDRGKMSAGTAETVRSRLGIEIDYDQVSGADIVVEAAFEDMAVKKDVFSKLQASAPASAILATNTSYLDVNEIAATLDDPSRLIGLHFFSPAHIMKLIEIVRGDKSSDRALAIGFSVAKRLGKVPVLAGVCDGFIGNRILTRYREVADMLLMDGATPWEIDAAMVEFGYPMGPYEAQDLSGLDIAYASRKQRAATRDPARRYVPIADRMVEEGRLGRKSGVGWYRYPGGGAAVVDPLVEDLILEEARFAKVRRRVIEPEEIRNRLLYAMINEAAAILEEKIASSASDVDLVSILGYGFPRWRGGLLHYADQQGAGKILEQVDEYALEDPVVWRASQLLVELGSKNKSFASV